VPTLALAQPGLVHEDSPDRVVLVVAQPLGDQVDLVFGGVCHPGGCNATVIAGCGTAREQPVGSAPLALAIDPGSHTVYVTNLFGGGSVSVFRTAVP
jgi:hypothetical protein